MNFKRVQKKDKRCKKKEMLTGVGEEGGGGSDGVRGPIVISILSRNQIEVGSHHQ